MKPIRKKKGFHSVARSCHLANVPSRKPVRLGKLAGSRILLAPVQVSDAGLFQKWMLDPAVTRNLNSIVLMPTIGEEKRWVQKIQKSRNDVALSIVLKRTGCVVGNCGLHRIDWRCGSAEFGIMVGEKSVWNKGFATEATRLLVDFGFRVLRLQSVHLIHLADHLSAHRVYEKAGFSGAGILRDRFFVDGKFFDGVLMDITRSDWAQGKVRP